MDRRPGTPSLLRELNDQAALDLLLAVDQARAALLGSVADPSAHARTQ